VNPFTNGSPTHKKTTPMRSASHEDAQGVGHRDAA
jgi:hypothetical protein